MEVQTYDRLSRDDILRVQRTKFAALTERMRGNPFFGPRLPGTSGPVDLAAIDDIPPMTKEDFLRDQERRPPFGDRLLVDPRDVAMVHTTGGTSGKGREIHALTWRDVEAAGHLSSFAFWWAGLQFREPGAFHIGMSNSTGGNAMLRGLQTIGQVPVLVGHEGFAERLELMQRFPPVGMYASPSAINGLAHLAREQGLNLRETFPSLRFLLTSAEPYPVDWALAMEEAWGARVFEDYGATQTASAIAASCCELGAVRNGGRGTMHLFDWAFLFEIVDPDSRAPVEPGEFGELLVTSLDKQASPVLRFSTRDRVRFLGWDQCSCGRELMAIECGSITRYDDMLKVKGQNVWPADMEALVLATRGIREFRGIVAIGERGRDELILEISCAPDVDREQLTQQLRRSFKSKFNLTPKVELVEYDELPQWHTPEAKARRFEDRRAMGLSASSGGPS